MHEELGAPVQSTQSWSAYLLEFTEMVPGFPLGMLPVLYLPLFEGLARSGK